MRPTTTAPWCPCSKGSPATQHRNQPQGRARLGPVLFGGGAAGAGRGAFWRSGAVPPRWGRGPESPVVRTLRVVRAFPVPRGAAPRGPACPAGSPFLPRNGEKEGRGQAPWTPGFMAARSHSLVLAWWGAAERWLGCFVAHVRALIWIRILRERGVVEKVFCCRSVPPAKASPWGEAVTEGDG